MNSPFKISFSSFIQIDRRKSDPIYLQIVYQFINAVQRRIVPLGVQLPGSRTISAQLKLHRKTVLAAIEELQAQSWIEVVPNKGMYAQNPQIQKKTIENEKKINFSKEKSTFSFQTSYLLQSTFEKSESNLQINDGQADYRLSDTKELARFYTNSLKRKNVQHQLGNASRSNDFFKDQLSFYVNINRGFHIDKNQLAIASSKEMLIYTLAQLLLKTGDLVLVGSYSYFFSNMIFNQVGAKIQTIPVDQQGIDVDFIERNFKKGEIKCLYVNSKNQYPTTYELSEMRRKKLITLSNRYDFIVIEEDTDFEMYYESKINLPLMHQTNGKVIYLGSFGKFLHPSFQRNFVVASNDLIEEMNKYLSIIDPSSDLIMEQALGEMIKEGDIYRYMRKNNTVYKNRRAQFAKLLTQELSQKIDFQVPKSGFAFWLVCKESISLTKVAQLCKTKDLFIPRICLYQNKAETAMRIGFGSLNEEEIDLALKTLKKVMNKKNI
jgi:GntR family transcriptional regulator/MocR family aminotransferase